MDPVPEPESLDPGLVRVHRSCCSFFFFSFLFSSRLWVKSILSGLLKWNFSFSSAPLFFDHGGGLRSVLYKKVLSAVTPHPPPSLPPWSFVSFSPKFLFLFFSSPSRSGSQSTEPQALTHVHSVSWFIDDGVMTSSSVSGFLQYVFSSHTNLRVRRRLLFFMKLLLQFWPLIIYQSFLSPQFHIFGWNIFKTKLDIFLNHRFNLIVCMTFYYLQKLNIYQPKSRCTKAAPWHHSDIMCCKKVI